MSGESAVPLVGRRCFREPIAEIYNAADYLNQAVDAHLSGQSKRAELLIGQADIPAIREWTESLWGKGSPYVQYRTVKSSPPSIERSQRARLRMPESGEKLFLLSRDNYRCRFCGMPVIRHEIRNRLRKLYPGTLRWSAKSNFECHAAFQAMWAQYDHILPHARGGTNDLANIVITCAPCNFARMNYTLEEVGLADPRMREPITSTWDGLERLSRCKTPSPKVHGG
jgi:5-methylcytosine-specific restriction endonuclease McrA